GSARAHLDRGHSRQNRPRRKGSRPSAHRASQVHARRKGSEPCKRHLLGTQENERMKLARRVRPSFLRRAVLLKALPRILKTWLGFSWSMSPKSIQTAFEAPQISRWKWQTASCSPSSAHRARARRLPFASSQGWRV